MKVLFYGSPDVAVPYLELLAAGKDCELVGAVTQSEKPAGRSLKVQPTPVKLKAQELKIPAFEPVNPSRIREDLKRLSPDLSIVVAYGKILKEDVLEIPRLGTLNVHFSILPMYRGAAPVQWSLVRGETRTGVTLFWLDQGMDTGPIFLQKELAIGSDEDAPELMERLTRLGLEALRQVLHEISAGRIRREPQSGLGSLAPLIKKEDARISLEDSAREIHNLVRGMRMWPRAFLDLARPSGPLRVQVLKTKLAEEDYSGKDSRAGSVLRVERGGGILIQCGGSSRLWFLTVQPEGKKPVTAADFLNGLRLKAGDFLPVSR